MLFCCDPQPDRPDIARECGILTERGTVMEGPEFRELSREEIDKVRYLLFLSLPLPLSQL